MMDDVPPGFNEHIASSLFQSEFLGGEEAVL